MTEHFQYEHMVHIAEHYRRSPFCNPEQPLDSPEDIIYWFNPVSAAARTRPLMTTLAAAYDAEKDPANAWEKAPTPGIDLRLPSHVQGMINHTITHSMTGTPEWGLSDTDCIPYWDRDAAIVGIRHLYSGPIAEGKIATMDGLSINMLRTYCAHWGEQAAIARQSGELIRSALEKGQRSKVDVADQQRIFLAEATTKQELYSARFATKLRHVLWLTDQQANQAVRHYLLPELHRLVQHAETLGLSPEDLTVDMGADTGIAETTSRPPYDIGDFVQLSHVRDDSGPTYAIPQAQCSRLSLTYLLDSIARPGTDLPEYEDGRYRLPWNFSDQ